MLREVTMLCLESTASLGLKEGSVAEKDDETVVIRAWSLASLLGAVAGVPCELIMIIRDSQVKVAI